MPICSSPNLRFTVCHVLHWPATHMVALHRRHLRPDMETPFDDIHAFITYLNSIQPTIKSTSNYSYAPTPFLVLPFFVDNGKITSDLYTKANDKHQHLLHSSCHPRHTKRAIPFSVALRHRRICSSAWRDFEVLQNNVLMNSNLCSTNADIIYLSLIKK